MNRKTKSIVIFIVSLLFFYSCSYPLLQVQERLRSILPKEATLKKLPPEIVFTTVLLGGFRSIIVNLLWLRATKLQQDGKYFELVQLADWIGLLQPELPSIWRFNAWNLAYNISVEFPTGEERWNWIYQGIKLLRDKALKYVPDPDSAKIYLELSWIIYHKISDTSDELNAYYKRMWAEIMQDVFGSMTLEEMAASPSYEELIKDKDVESIISSLKEKQIDILGDWAEIPKDNFAELPEEITGKPSFRKLEAYLRAKRLREEFKMDLEFMLELEKKYCPLNWKSSGAHSLYWIEEGKRKTTERREIDYQRMVYLSLNHLWQWGNVKVKKINDEKILILAPDFKVVPVLNAYYENAIKELEEGGEEGLTTGVRSSHLYFLRDVVVLAYTINNLPVAQRYYLYLRERYPGEIAGLSFQDYVASKFVKTVEEGSIVQITNILFGIMQQSYWALATGEDERYVGLQSLAKSIHMKTSEKVSRFRKLFPTFEALQKSTLDASLPMLPPSIASSLRNRLGMEEPAATEEEEQTIDNRP